MECITSKQGSSDRLAIGLGFSICGKGIAPILILTECPCLVTLHLTILKIEPSNYAEFLFQFFFISSWKFGSNFRSIIILPFIFVYFIFIVDPPVILTLRKKWVENINDPSCYKIKREKKKHTTIEGKQLFFFLFLFCF